MNLSSTIKSIQDIMRKDDGVDGDAQRIGQLTWLLFLKVFDQREQEWEDDNNKYKSPESMQTDSSHDTLSFLKGEIGGN